MGCPSLPRASTAIAIVLMLSGCATMGDNGLAAGGRQAETPQVLATLQVADAALRRGDTDGAALLYERALRAEPQNITAARGLAEALERGGNLEGAAAANRAVLAINSADVVAMRRLARLQLATGQAKSGIDTYARLLTIDGTDTDARNGMAVARCMTGACDQSIADYRGMLERLPDDRTLRNNLGFTLLLTGDAAAAVSVLEPFANDPKAEPRHRQTLALAYGLAGREADAERIGRMDLDATTVSANLDFLSNRSMAASEADGAGKVTARSRSPRTAASDASPRPRSPQSGGVD